ncbi:MAG TPA: SpoIIE family protein phosphatase [Spirochaetota bacterium]|nr:SpoIIE family protein phosphatase [Spirochaetota bacterium]
MKEKKPAETGSSWSQRLKKRAAEFSIAEFIRNRPFLKKKMPGIRLKLAALFGLFVALILAAATLFNYINQSRILEEGFKNEVEASLKYINSAAVSMESVRTNILLIEEMKLRIKEKQRDLKKYRNYVYRRRDSLGNMFKSLGRKLGMKVRYDYYRRGYDTYYSIYLTEKEISALEKRVAEQLRHKDGSPATAAEIKRVFSRGSSVSYYQRRIDSIEKKIDEKAPQAEEEGKEKIKEPKEVRILRARLKREKKRKAYADRRFRKTLKGFYEHSFRRLEDTGIENSSIRIITFAPDGDINYDTGNLLRDGIVNFAPLMKDKKYLNDRYNFFSSSSREEAATDEFRYMAGGRSYSVRYMPVFKNPATYERLVTLTEELEDNSSLWLPYLKEDARISGLTGELAVKIKERLSILRKERKIPGKDSEYRALYSSYRKLLNEREKAFDTLAPYSDEARRLNEYYKEQIKIASSEISRIKKSISAFKKDPGTDDEEDIKNRLESLKALIDENIEKTAMLKKEMARAREDIWQSGKLTANDSMKFIREAALLDFTILRQKSNPRAYREYLKSSRARAVEAARFNTLRRWIMSGENETGLPGKVRGRRNTSLAGDGILAYSRSEAEEYMWLIDSTPVAGDIGIFSAETEGGLISDLRGNNITGYNAVIIDKTEGIKRVESNRNMMILYSSLIALFSVIFTYFLAGFMVKRIKGIIGQTFLAGRGDLSVQFPEKGLDEIEELGVSLNSMIKGLREKEELKGEIAAAGEIQKILLPEKIPSTLEGFYSIGTFYRSMNGVGGDYYDIIELDESRILFCIGDVSNHGVGPAIVMSMLRAHLHGIIKRGGRDLIEILCELNRQIFLETPSHIFVTLFVGIIDRGTNEIEYCSAGHLRPAVYRYRKNDIEVLEGGGLPVGMDDNDFFTDTISVSRTKLAAGDLFFQYTDGANEAMNSSREQFGDERIFAELKQYARKNPGVMIQQIALAIENFTGKKIIDSMVSELNDDLAMIAFKRIK